MLVTYLLVFLMTLVKRKEPHIFVANWFYSLSYRHHRRLASWK